VILAIISKLPIDLKDVMHILPFWFTYLYYFLWIAGIAVVVILIIFLSSKLIQYLQSLKVKEDFASETARERSYTKIELSRDLKLILDKSIKNSEYRFGLHRMSAILKTYFEILLKKDIEEMTAKEIRTHVKEKKRIGVFFTEITVTQFRNLEPDKEEFVGYYKKAVDLIR